MIDAQVKRVEVATRRAADARQVHAEATMALGAALGALEAAAAALVERVRLIDPWARRQQTHSTTQGGRG